MKADREKLKEFGAVVAEKLIEIGMTQKQLAILVGTSPTQINKIIGGKTPGVIYRNQIVKLLEIDSKYRHARKNQDIHCPTCRRKGQVTGRVEDTVMMICECGEEWEMESHVCPKCGQPNGYAVKGLCIECYSNQLEAKYRRKADRGMNVWWMGVGA